jgi:hypothetical protein
MKIEIKKEHGHIDVRVDGRVFSEWVYPGAVCSLTGWLYKDLLALGNGAHEITPKGPEQAESKKRKKGKPKPSTTWKPGAKRQVKAKPKARPGARTAGKKK